MITDKESTSTSEFTSEGLAKLVATANAGDKAALGRLRQVLDFNPTVWRTVGDLGEIAKTMLITAISGNDNLLIESLRRQVAEMEQTLLDSDASPVEKLAAERVVIAWLQLQQADLRCARPEGLSVGWAGFWIRAQAQAARRYESAIRHLEVVERMEGRKRQRQTLVPRSGDAATEAPNRTPQRRQRGSSASASAEHNRRAPNMRTVAAATGDQAAQGDVAAREAVIPFVRPDLAPVSAYRACTAPLPS